MKEYFLSVAKIDALPDDAPDNALVTREARDGGYVWCLWDIYPSKDTARAPLISGYERDRKGVIRAAESLGMLNYLRFRQRHHVNERLVDMCKHNGPIISHLKQGAKSSVAVWIDHISYLVGRKPLALRANLTHEQAYELITALGNGNPHCADGTSSYLRNYLRRLHLAEKAARPASESDYPAVISVLYSRDYYGRDFHHRVIRKTPKHILVDILPHRLKGSFLLPEWRSRLIDIAMLPRAEFESSGECLHRPSGRTYYSSPPHDFRPYNELEDDNFDAFINEEYPPEYHKSGYSHASADDAEDVIEMPEDAIAWAISALRLEAWPATLAAIKTAWRKMAALHHPDKGGSPEQFRLARTAYEYLLFLR